MLTGQKNGFVCDIAAVRRKSTLGEHSLSLFLSNTLAALLFRRPLFLGHRAGVVALSDQFVLLPPLEFGRSRLERHWYP